MIQISLIVKHLTTTLAIRIKKRREIKKRENEAKQTNFHKLKKHKHMHISFLFRSAVGLVKVYCHIM